MTDRFDFEQQIMACWMITSDIDDLFEEVMENDSLTKDQISNVLLGLHDLYEIKFNKLFRQFEEMIKARSFYEFPAPKTTDSAYISPLNPRIVSDAEFDDRAELLKKAEEFVEALDLPPPSTTKAKKKKAKK